MAHSTPTLLLLLNLFSAIPAAAVLLAGQAMTGKTAALQTVVSALNARGPSDKGTNTSVKMLRIFPGTCGDPSELYGHVNPTSGDWLDGIFTSIFRKAHKVLSYQLLHHTVSSRREGAGQRLAC